MSVSALDLANGTYGRSQAGWTDQQAAASETGDGGQTYEITAPEPRTPEQSREYAALRREQLEDRVKDEEAEKAQADARTQEYRRHWQ
jgi:hypothetical protein